MKSLSKKDLVLFLLLGFLTFNTIKTMFTGVEVSNGYTERELELIRELERSQVIIETLHNKDKQLQNQIHNYEKVIHENTVRIVNSSKSYRDSLRSAINPR